MCLIPGLVLKQASQMASAPPNEPLPPLRTDFNDNHDHNPTLNPTLSPTQPQPYNPDPDDPASRVGQLQHAPPDGHVIGSPHGSSGGPGSRDGTADVGPARPGPERTPAGFAKGSRDIPEGSRDTPEGHQQPHFRPWLGKSSKSTELRKSNHPYYRVTESP